MVASADIKPNQVLLSVPMDKVFKSKVDAELKMHWAADMALDLLQLRHEYEASRSVQDCSSTSNVSGHSSTVDWAPFLSNLPSDVTGPLQFTTEEAKQLVISSAVRDVLNMQECLEYCYEELQCDLASIGCGWSDFKWAVQVLHSRCFYDPISCRHLAVPGIDMANHSSAAPNADVRLSHLPSSPDYAVRFSRSDRGHRLASTKTPVINSPELNCVQLVAGPEGISSGEQVTISYGSWPGESFLLHYGFLPNPNPHDALTLFSCLQQMAACYLGCLQHKLMAQAAKEVVCSCWAQQAVDADRAKGLEAAPADTTDNCATDVIQATLQLLQKPAFTRQFLTMVRAAELGDDGCSSGVQSLATQSRQEQDSRSHSQQHQAEDGTAASRDRFLTFKDMFINQAGIDRRLPLAMEQHLHPAVVMAAAEAAEAVVGLDVGSAPRGEAGGVVGKFVCHDAHGAELDTGIAECGLARLPSAGMLQHLQLPLKELLIWRMEGLVRQLDDMPPAAAVTASGRQLQLEVDQQQAQRHAELIRQYRQSKAALAKQLIANVLRCKL
eukprot:gene12282-12418_t